MNENLMQCCQATVKQKVFRSSRDFVDYIQKRYELIKKKTGKMF